MTLRELLKDKVLPVKVECEQWLGDGQFVEIFGVNATHVIGFDEKAYPWEARLAACDHFNWILYQAPKPKKKMYAYLVRPNVSTPQPSYDLRYLLEEDWLLLSEGRDEDTPLFVRAPTLDVEVEDV